MSESQSERGKRVCVCVSERERERASETARARQRERRREREGERDGAPSSPDNAKSVRVRTFVAANRYNRSQLQLQKLYQALDARGSLMTG